MVAIFSQVGEKTTKKLHILHGLVGKAWAKNGNKIDIDRKNDALVQMFFSFQGSPVFSGSIRGVVPRRGTPQKSNHRYQKWPYFKPESPFPNHLPGAVFQPCEKRRHFVDEEVHCQKAEVGDLLSRLVP